MPMVDSSYGYNNASLISEMISPQCWYAMRRENVSKWLIGRTYVPDKCVTTICLDNILNFKPISHNVTGYTPNSDTRFRIKPDKYKIRMQL